MFTMTRVVFQRSTPPTLACQLHRLPPILHKPHRTPIPNYSKGSGVFPSFCASRASLLVMQFRRVHSRDSGEVVAPFVQVGTYPTRNFATLGWLYLPPPFTRSSLLRFATTL